jgi:hypothetical protein
MGEQEEASECQGCSVLFFKINFAACNCDIPAQNPRKQMNQGLTQGLQPVSD